MGLSLPGAGPSSSSGTCSGILPKKLCDGCEYWIGCVDADVRGCERTVVGARPVMRWVFESACADLLIEISVVD